MYPLVAKILKGLLLSSQCEMALTMEMSLAGADPEFCEGGFFFKTIDE